MYPHDFSLSLSLTCKKIYMSNMKLVNGFPFTAYHKESYDTEEMINRSTDFYHWADKRRTCRDIGNRPVPKTVIENILKTASTAPSGAHKQPWTFVAISNPDIKKAIRKAAEEEEYKSYHGRMSEEWLEDLAPIGTDWEKPFLETAPWLIVVLRRSYELMPDGSKRQNYYVQESCGIACGLLLTAIHHAGLVALTHTPSPMNFLTEILNRPENEKPFLLIPVGYAANEAWVPDLKRKSLEDMAVWFE
jgi:nitroreductase